MSTQHSYFDIGASAIDIIEEPKFLTDSVWRAVVEFLNVPYSGTADEIILNIGIGSNEMQSKTDGYADP